MEDVARLYQALYQREPSVGVAYAVGALAGLRTGEVRGLRWSDVNLERLELHVQRSADGPLKAGESRIVPIQPSLAPILVRWREQSASRGYVCPPLRGDGEHLDDHTMSAYLREEATKLGLTMTCGCCSAPANWYNFTRHTYGSQWVRAGGSIEELSRTMGHSTIAVTEHHYVHLRPDCYRVSARNVLRADFGTETGQLATELVTEGGSSNGRRRTKAA